MSTLENEKRITVDELNKAHAEYSKGIDANNWDYAVVINNIAIHLRRLILVEKQIAASRERVIR